MKKQCSSDLTDSQWNHIKELFEKEKERGKTQQLELRRIVNGVLFILVSGCQWRNYPKWQSVYYHFHKWTKAGLWKEIHARVRVAARVKSGKHKHTAAGAMDRLENLAQRWKVKVEVSGRNALGSSEPLFKSYACVI